ncbi:MAG: hypothetical protein BWX93_01557 [Bacteroidetes bacterium ADurb.Bin139]|nr:MAG: hypothetical protein BWX93_01557 [Bacteroidetes bacterium ADurb.Bin139]
MKAYAWLVKNIKAAYKGTSQRADQVDTLALSPAQSGRPAVQCQVTKSYLVQEMKAGRNFRDSPSGNLQFSLVPAYAINKGFQIFNVHFQKLVYTSAVDSHIRGLFAQPGPPANGTLRLADITAYQDPVLDLVAGRFQFFKKWLNSRDTGISIPKPLLFCCGKLVIGLVHGKTRSGCIADHFVLVGAHDLTFPAGNGILINRKALVRNNERFIYAGHLPVTTAFGTSPQGTVKAEQVFGRFHERNPVGFKTFGKSLRYLTVTNKQHPLSNGEGRPYRFKDPGPVTGIIPRLHATGQQQDIPGSIFVHIAQQVPGTQHFLSVMKADVPILLQLQQVLYPSQGIFPSEGGKQQGISTRRQ